jgi:hypothetical protein
MKTRAIIAGWIIILLCWSMLLSCGGKVTTRTDGEEKLFTINGVVVKDRNSGTDFAYFNVLRDSDAFDGAVVKVGAYSLTSQGSGNYFKQGSSLFSYGQSVSVTVTSSGDDFNLTTSVLMPGSFQITSFNPPVVTSDETHLVKMYGSASSGASGYFVNVIRPNASSGYEGLVSLGQMTNGALFPRETFESGGIYMTGTYTVYAIAYSGSFTSYPGMPFFLPDGLPTGNISGANGTVGAGVIAPLESLTAQ